MTRRICFSFALPLMCLAPVWAAPPAATQPTTFPSTAPTAATTQPVQHFMRFVDHGTTGSRLETEDVTYRNDAGVTVRLVSAVHIAEKSYYDALNQSFEKDDAVLYEMVKPKDAPAPLPGHKSDNPISQFQHFLKDSMGLEFQLDAIDYQRPNFVHADLDAETFEKMQAERGESMMTLMLKAMMEALSHPNPASAQAPEQTIGDLIAVLTRPDAERQIKLMLARQMGDIENMTIGLDGPGGSVIVTERNKAALQTLKDTIATGKKNLAIFYGAAHMPDMEKRLAEMGFRPVGHEWRMAWDLSIRSDQPSMIEQFLRDAFK